MTFTARVRRHALSSCFGSAFGIRWGAPRLPARCQSLFAGLSVGRAAGALWVAAGVFMGAAVRRRQAMKQATAHTTQSIAIKGWITRHPALALSPLALGAAACIVMLALGQPIPAAAAFARYPGLPAPWPLAAVVAAVVLVNGFGEETGCRGFLTERLLPRHGHLRSTLWVALLWSVWHLPLFWLNAGMAAQMGPILMGWLFALFCGAFVWAQVYLVTGHCILCVALWHAAFNLLVSSESDTGSFAAIISTAVMVWGFVVALRWWRSHPCACDLHRASVMDAICTLFHKAGRR